MGDKELEAFLRAETVPARGATAPLEFSDGRIVDATVLEVDGVSDPPRVKVNAECLEQPLLVSLLAPGAPFPQAAAPGGILDSLKEEVQGTVQDFREKGAVTMFKDAALDAVDIVGSTAGKAAEAAGKAAEGARSLASPLIDLDWTPEAGPEGQTDAQQSQSTVQQLVTGLKQEFKDTVQDFREKGAVGTFKDAALDAVDIVGSTAATAVEGAKSVAKQTLPDLWAEQGPSGEAESAPSGAESQGNSSASTAPAPATSSPAAAATSTSAPSSASEKSAPSGGSAGYVASPAPAAPAAKSPGGTSPGSGSGGYAPASPTAPKVVEPPSDASSSDMQDAKPARKSIVSMRRNMFEKAKDEPKKEEEEMID